MNNFNWLKAGTYEAPADTQQIFNIDEETNKRYFKVYYFENDGYIKIKNKNGVEAYSETADVPMLIKVDRGTCFNISVQDGTAAVIVYNSCALNSTEIDATLQMFRGGAMISFYSEAKTQEDISSSITDLLVAFTTNS